MRFLRQAGVALTLSVLGPGVARAEPAAEDKAFAEALFRQGREAMAEKRLEEACTKFAESQRLDPALGTLLNVAVCHERQGRVASAWAEFTDAAAQAEHEQSAERATFAHHHATTLEALLAFVAIDVPASRPEGLAIELDGRALGEGSWGASLPADPGTHTVVVRAPGLRTWRTQVEVGEPKTVARVRVPTLGVQEGTPPPSLDIPPPPARGPRDTESANAPVNETPPRARSVAALAAGGPGVAGIVVGAVFGALAIHEKSLRSAVCNGQNVCSAQSGVDADTLARQDATVSSVAFSAGAAGVATGVLIYFLWPSGHRQNTGGLRPWVGRDGGGLDGAITW